ncbi:hypothetical protein [Caulobacter sp. 17J65-9]|uniref:hypothetical protein n=1 Tax=Caulobacter sp. 17J65-9 TaxID=2709382 RepID=UPI0013C7206B|nr:hypothetical protein [Caulobacter sp. 17J65-9]NEX94125.1 hypothetical protein [Caulobacter sp. 17J65-9]
MVWVRRFFALLVSALFLTMFGGAAVMLVQSANGRDVAGDPPQWLQNLVPPPSGADAAALKAPYEDLRAGRTEALTARLADNVDRQAAEPQLAAMRALVPPGPAPEPRRMSWNRFTGTDGERMSVIYEYHYPERVVRTETTISRPNAKAPWKVEGFFLRSATHKELEAARFNPATMPPQGQVMVGLTALVPLFMWATAMVVLLGSGVRRRWLWLPVVLVGVGKLSMNAATCAFGFWPISLQLFGASAFWSGSAFDAWMLAVSLPLGAIVFWVRRMQRG